MKESMTRLCSLGPISFQPTFKSSASISSFLKDSVGRKNPHIKSATISRTVSEVVVHYWQAAGFEIVSSVVQRVKSLLEEHQRCQKTEGLRSIPASLCQRTLSWAIPAFQGQPSGPYPPPPGPGGSTPHSQPAVNESTNFWAAWRHQPNISIATGLSLYSCCLFFAASPIFWISDNISW